MDNRFLLLPLQFDVRLLIDDLATCEAEQWTAHFNQNDYAGDWSGIALRSASGSTTDINTVAPHAFTDTPLLGRCPYFRTILDGFACGIETVRLLALSPGSVIKEHRDLGLGYEHGRFRLHIPITTDSDVAFVVDGSRLQMDAGQCWYANFSLPHSVQHHGTTRRIHLVIDGLRNEWTDQLFERSGYSFEVENESRKYDSATRKAMIKQLRLMDTDTARALIAQLEQDVASESNLEPDQSQNEKPQLEKGWIPIALDKSGHTISFKWGYTNERPFSEPFFHETLARVRHTEISRKFSNTTSTLDQLIDIAQGTDSILPDAFIFHVSRCGSTLLSQALCADAQNIVLSEVPLLDALLRLSFQDKEIAQEIIDQAFVNTVRILGSKKNKEENHLFIKTDSWHIFFYETLRRLYPMTPFILLYRHPYEVIRSHQRQRGIQSIPSTLEPALTGINDDPSGYADLDGYLVLLLEQFFSSLIRIKSTDTNTFLINYSSGLPHMLAVVEKVTGISFTKESYQKMNLRGQFNAKRPHEPFVQEGVENISISRLEKLTALYAQLDAMQV